MKKRERENRVEALNHAVRHRLATETPANIVTAAGLYLNFLRGKGEETSDGTDNS